MSNLIRYKNFIAIYFLIFLISCQSTVRFSSHISELTFDTRSLDISLLKLDDRQLVVVSESKGLIGTPYCYGGTGTNCFDCSGFVQEIFQKIGVKLPRSAEDQYLYSKIVTKDEVKPADLVFFGNNKKISHVGIYVGNNTFIHSSSSKGVMLQSLDEKYYREHFAGFGRVIE